jgi:hypothetical protein
MCAARPKPGFRFTLADLLCVVAFVGVAVGLPISLAQAISVKQNERVLTFGSQRTAEDGTPALDRVPVVVLEGRIVSSRWQLARRKLSPVPHLVILAAVGLYALRRSKSKTNKPLPSDRTIRDPAALTPGSSPSLSGDVLSSRGTAVDAVTWCFGSIAAIAGLTIGGSLLVLSFVWFGPGPTLLVCVVSWFGLFIGAIIVRLKKRRRPSPRSASGSFPQGIEDRTIPP